jgi:arginyl-tRNA--protein-N-Asp/Glu arginylyltransferase
MIEVVFDHIGGFGKVTKEDFIYSNPIGIARNTLYLSYLEKGWIEWEGYWYNLRSVRVKVADYKPTKTVRKLSKRVRYELTLVDNYLIEQLKPVYDSYVKHKEFERNIDLNQFFGYRALVYYHNDTLVGANIFKLYLQDNRSAFVSYQFLWDYADPTLSLGNVSQYYEIDLAKKFECDFIYLLGGYETSSLYKSQYKGFQWWTGQQWSTDVELYQTLCKRDDHIRAY